MASLIGALWFEWVGSRGVSTGRHAIDQLKGPTSGSSDSSSDSSGRKPGDNPDFPAVPVRFVCLK